MATSLTVTGLNGFSDSVTVNFTGLPSGVAASPSSLKITPNGSQSVTFHAAADAAVAPATVTATATGGGLTHSITLTVTVLAKSAGAHPPGKTQYIRTDGQYAFSGQSVWANLAVFDKTDEEFFLSGVGVNRLDVFDANSETQIGSIPISGAYGIDIAPDDSIVWVATEIGDLYAVNPKTLTIQQVIHPQDIGGSGFSPAQVLALKNGDLAFLAMGFGSDGSPGFAIWNATTNVLQNYLSFNVGLPTFIAPFAVSGDRSKVFAGSADSDGTVYVYDSATQAVTSVNSGSEFIRAFIPSPDGTRMYVVGNLGLVNVLDVATLQSVGQFTDGDYGGPGTVSADGKTLYLGSPISGGIDAVDTTSLQFKGQIPALVIPDFLQGLLPMTISDTGLLFGPIGHGAAFTDGTKYQTANLQNFFNLGDPSPNQGSLSGGTAVSGEFLTAGGYTGSEPAAMYIGANQATNVTTTSELYNATTPQAAVPGIADLMLIQNDGQQNMIPQGYAYGPQVISTSNAATADGGGVVTIFGYGFGSKLGDATVTIGGASCQILNFLGEATPYIPYPFYNMSALQVAAPPDTPGSADLVITTSIGSWTSPGAITYVPAATLFPLPGASLEQGIYDPVRDVYYFSNTNEIEVLSLTKGWQAPIKLKGTNSTTRLWGLGLSPNSNILVASDTGNFLIYGVDLTNPANSVSVATTELPNNGGQRLLPTGLAPLNDGVVYYTAAGLYAFHNVNLQTGAAWDFMKGGIGGGDSATYDRVKQSPDGKYIYYNVSGSLGILDLATREIMFPPTFETSGNDVEFSFSGDGSSLVSSEVFGDNAGNATGEISYVDYDTWAVASVYGQKLNSDGSLLYQPLTGGVDLLDATAGLLKARLGTPFSLANVYDALAVDGTTDGQVLAITGSGDTVAVMDLSRLAAVGIEPEKKSPIHAKVVSHATEKSGTQSGTRRHISHGKLLLRESATPRKTRYLMSASEGVQAQGLR